jgi:hypothetical protein
VSEEEEITANERERWRCGKDEEQHKRHTKVKMHAE